MAFLPAAAEIAAPIISGLINSGAQSSAENQAADLANRNTQNAFDSQTNYANGLRGQLTQEVNGFQNPFIQALSQIKPTQTPYQTQTFGQSGVPMSNGSAASNRMAGQRAQFAQPFSVPGGGGGVAAPAPGAAAMPSAPAPGAPPAAGGMLQQTPGTVAAGFAGGGGPMVSPQAPPQGGAFLTNMRNIMPAQRRAA